MTYLKLRRLLVINSDVNGCWQNKIIADLALATRVNACHIGAKGNRLSKGARVTPYGKSVKIQSTELSGRRFMPSMQSSLKI